jgi:Domain of unknown function (DU1801)
MAGKPNRTQETTASVEAFVAAIDSPDRRADCETLSALMARLSGEPARMWGPSIVGFGVRHYRYDSGREGDILRIGFSPRKAAISLYVTGETEGDPMVAALGKITHGKSCINMKRLADIDLAALEALIRRTLAKA